MDQSNFVTKSESDDEKFLTPDLIKQVRVFAGYALALIILTYICIWGVNYQKDSMFSTTTGKIETVKSPEGS
ncbi:hypothetical protein MJH12_10575 [bacterium]|nr:hypothetical protein [bacterium]